MWCGHCQADVAAEVSPDNQRIHCANCGQEIVPAEKLRTTVKTREARELLERWSNQKHLDPYGPVVKKDLPTSAIPSKPATAQSIPGPLAPTGVSQQEALTIEIARSKSSNTESNDSLSSPGAQHNSESKSASGDPNKQPATDVSAKEKVSKSDADSVQNTDESNESSLNEKPHRAAQPGSDGPHFGLAEQRREERRQQRRKRSKPKFRVDSAHPVPRSAPTETEQQTTTPQQPTITGQQAAKEQVAQQQAAAAPIQPPTVEQINYPQPVAQHAPAHAPFPSANPPQPATAQHQPQVRWDEAHHPVLSAPHFDIQAAANRRQKAGINWTGVFGQLLAYSGVAMLTTGTILVLWGYFGGPTNYTPTGWLIATAGQMLLFLGVVTLVSGGMEQTTQEVSRRIDSLGDKLIRIEQASRDHALRGPKIPAQYYADGPPQQTTQDQYSYVER